MYVCVYVCMCVCLCVFVCLGVSCGVRGCCSRLCRDCWEGDGVAAAGGGGCLSSASAWSEAVTGVTVFCVC